MSDNLRASLTTLAFVVVAVLLTFAGDALEGAAHGATGLRPVDSPATSSSSSWSPSWSPCALEDSPGPCVWDARHRGNGQGHSFIRRTSGTVVPVSHHRAHRMLCGAVGGAA